MTLELRQEQMDAFDAASYGRYVHQTRSYLREKYPYETEELSNDRLDGFIHRGRRTAAGHEVTEPGDVLSLIEATVVMGEDYLDEESARSVLEDESLTAEQKADTIFQGAMAFRR